MKSDYADYEPLILDAVSVNRLKSDEYRAFIYDCVITPSVRMLLERHRARPDWPYIDTKFNPNTGQDLPESSYDVVFTWFLGRGAEALDGHLGILDQLPGLSRDERSQARDLFGTLISNMIQAIAKTIEINNARLPFRMNRELQGIDQHGRPVQADTKTRAAGEIFCAKGLIAQGSGDNVRRGLDILLETADFICRNQYAADQFGELPADIWQAPRMLALSAVPLLFTKTQDPVMRAQALDLADGFIRHVLDIHYDAETALFSEYVDVETRTPKPLLDPGHAGELVGFALAATDCMSADAPTPERRSLIDRTRHEMPRLLIKAVELGFNTRHPGIYKAVDNLTGEVINDDMPWWNIPEAMRAAARCVEVTDDDPTRDRCLEILRICHNAYFTSYPNPDNALFPFQTISGATGEVVDKVPAVPEGDPFYHTNLALLDMLDVLDRLQDGAT